MTIRHPRRALAASLLATAALWAPAAFAQPATPQPTPPADPKPTPASLRADPRQPSPYLTLVRKREWTVRAQITLRADHTNPYQRYSNLDWFRFEHMSMVFPVAQVTGSSVWREGSIEGTLFLAQSMVDDTPELIGPYHSEAAYARYDARDGHTRTVRLVHAHEITSWDTVFNEQAALRVPWPEGPWPDEAMSTFGPQEFINPKGQPEPVVVEMLMHWTQGKDPKSISPVLLAKWLAGSVQEYVHLEGDGVNRAYYLAGGSAAEGVELKGAGETIRARRGSSHDMACLLAALYRAAGLPARIIIGVDEDPERSSRELRSWVEFCLYDEKLGHVVWIPVDVAKLRARSNRMLALDRPWEYFGTHDELHQIAPFAFHFVPPVDVRSYNSPAFYGWRQTPLNAPNATQIFDIDVNRTTQHGPPKRETP